jgi:hypothetical protein
MTHGCRGRVAARGRLGDAAADHEVLLAFDVERVRAPVDERWLEQVRVRVAHRPRADQRREIRGTPVIRPRAKPARHRADHERGD